MKLRVISPLLFFQDEKSREWVLSALSFVFLMITMLLSLFKETFLKKLSKSQYLINNWELNHSWFFFKKSTKLTFINFDDSPTFVAGGGWLRTIRENWDWEKFPRGAKGAQHCLRETHHVTWPLQDQHNNRPLPRSILLFSPFLFLCTPSPPAHPQQTVPPFLKAALPSTSMQFLHGWGANCFPM